MGLKHILIRIGILIFLIGSSLFIYKSYYENTLGNRHHSGDVGDLGLLLMLIYILMAFCIAFIFEMIYLAILKRKSLVFFLTTLTSLFLIAYAFNILTFI